MIPIKTSFDSLPDAELENKSQNILLKVSTEKVFTPPFAELAAFEALVKAFSEALALAIDGGRVVVARKNAARKALIKMLKKVAGYVAMIASDDITIIIAGGFEAYKPKQPRPVITMPENIQVTSGANSGEIQISVNKVDNVQIYYFEYTAEDPLPENAVWKTVADTRCSYLFTGLKPGQKYWFRVAAVGRRGMKIYSNEVSCFVQ